MADNQTLSQRFLDLYLSDPDKNPFGQFYTTPYSGSVVGELPRSYEQYGRLTNPRKLAQQLLTAGGIPEVAQAGRDLTAETRNLRQENYQAYRQPYTEAQNLYREQRAAGFESPEAAQQARQGLAAVREATFLPYLANRGYLEAEEQLQKYGIRQARSKARLDALRESLASRGMKEEDIKSSTKGFRQGLRRVKEAGRLSYKAVKDVGRGGEVALEPRMTVGESLVKMMSDARSAPRDEAWYAENRSNQSPGQGAGYESRPESTATPKASELLGLNLAVGGKADVLNRKDIKDALESGMTKKEIRKEVKEQDIRMSAKAKAQLFKKKK